MSVRQKLVYYTTDYLIYADAVLKRIVGRLR